MTDTKSNGPRKAAAVILVRPTDGGPEVFLLRRTHKASFMSSAFVFPGGAADPGEDDLRRVAARELAEEAGITLPDPAKLAYFSHWITPSFERKRFSATFFVAELPPGQTAAADGTETTECLWITPDLALDRRRELRLPPPQVRTLWELSQVAADGIAGIFGLCEQRAAAPHPILPRILPAATPLTLLLPWDPDYLTAGDGDALPMAADHVVAGGPSRFVLDDLAWRHINAPA